MRKLASCICGNKDADQLRGDREADQRLCFHYTDNTITLLPKSEISSLQLFSVAVQPRLCQTWSETPKTGFLTTRLYVISELTQTDGQLQIEEIDMRPNTEAQHLRFVIDSGYDHFVSVHKLHVDGHAVHGAS